jgi:hypothetical protein
MLLHVAPACRGIRQNRPTCSSETPPRSTAYRQPFTTISLSCEPLSRLQILLKSHTRKISAEKVEIFAFSAICGMRNGLLSHAKWRSLEQRGRDVTNHRSLNCPALAGTIEGVRGESVDRLATEPLESKKPGRTLAFLPDEIRSGGAAANGRYLIQCPSPKPCRPRAMAAEDGPVSTTGQMAGPARNPP